MAFCEVIPPTMPVLVLSIREQLGLTQTEFGRLVGTNIRTVIRWEAGTCRPTTASAHVIDWLRERLRGRRTDKRFVRFIRRCVTRGGLPGLLDCIAVTDPERTP